MRVTVNLEFSIADIALTDDLQFRGLSVRCIVLELTAGGAECARAEFRAKHSPFGSLDLSAELRWQAAAGPSVRARGRIGSSAKVALVLETVKGGRRMQLTLDDFDLPALTALTAEVPFFGDHAIDTGTASLRADCTIDRSGSRRCALNGSIVSLNLNGSNVAEDLDASFSGNVTQTATAMDFDGKVELNSGAIYVEPGFEMGGIKPGFFVAIGSEPIELAAAITGIGSSDVRIRHVRLEHPGVVDMQFAGDLRFEPEPRWQALKFTFGADSVKRFYKTYLQPLALGTAFGSLETTGGLHLALGGKDDEIDELTLRFDEVYIDDDKRRFSLYGLDGEIDLHAGAAPRESHVGWIGGSLYKIPIGAGRIDWTSARRNLQVASWQDVDVFDGELRLDALEVHNFSLGATELALSGTLTPITLSALTAAFGWMPLSGKLSGEIPRLTYASNRLRLDGDLKVKIFDGTITIRDLGIDKLFSTVPVLSASIAVDQISLEELTRTLSFGNITGLLDGRVDDLVLQAWQPIRFDASFATAVEDPTPHRISRQAVDNLGRLGAGTGSALSQGWLSLIPSYSYGRLGIGCQLLNGHCQMTGVAPDDDGGFFILTRGGIFPPWINVKGSGRRINWQTLVDGIKQISRGKVELNIGAGRAGKTQK